MAAAGFGITDTARALRTAFGTSQLNAIAAALIDAWGNALGDITKALRTVWGSSQLEKIAKALRGQAKAGYAFMAGKQGYPLRYAKSFDMGNGKRQIILATDRPVSFGEVYQQTQLGDFDVTLVVLTLDENGKGEGVLSLGTELKWNDKEGKIEMTNVSSQPIKLGGVRPNK